MEFVTAERITDSRNMEEMIQCQVDNCKKNIPWLPHKNGASFTSHLSSYHQLFGPKTEVVSTNLTTDEKDKLYRALSRMISTDGRPFCLFETEAAKEVFRTISEVSKTIIPCPDNKSIKNTLKKTMRHV